MNICIFASSSNNIDKVYYDDARKLGELIAQLGFNIVYGGSELGLMGEITNTAQKLGVHVTGVMPEKLYNLGISKGNCADFILTKGMRERKAKMDELSDAVIALAGGFGTVEELSEMLVQKQLGYSNKPIVILNTNNYYGHLIKFFDNAIKENFAPELCRKLYFVANTPEDAIEYMVNYKIEQVNYLKDKIKV